MKKIREFLLQVKWNEKVKAICVFDKYMWSNLHGFAILKRNVVPSTNSSTCKKGIEKCTYPHCICGVTSKK